MDNKEKTLYFRKVYKLRDFDEEREKARLRSSRVLERT